MTLKDFQREEHCCFQDIRYLRRFFNLFIYNSLLSCIVLTFLMAGGPLEGISIAFNLCTQQVSTLFNPPSEDEKSSDEETNISMNTNAQLMAQVSKAKANCPYMVTL